jgi:hypothetical protein
MAGLARMGLLAASFTAGAALAANSPAYILSGYTFGGLPKGVSSDQLTAKLKHKQGDRITQADISADQAVLVRELEARHIAGRLFATLAEKHGHAWVIFDLQKTDPAIAEPGAPNRIFAAQNFEGAVHVSAGALAHATGLTVGETLSLENLKAARRAIIALYAKSMPGEELGLKLKLQTKPGGKTTLTWTIREPK